MACTKSTKKPALPRPVEIIEPRSDGCSPCVPSAPQAGAARQNGLTRSVPVLLAAITGASLMAGPAAAQEVQRECKRDLPQVGEFDLYQCAVEEYGIVPPRGGAYSHE